MKLQEKQKNQSGITLVALVVTIIILIILATISIRMVIGEGGLIWQANNAKVEYRAAEVDEEVLAWKAEKQMAKYTNGITPQGRDELIEDQLKRGLLTQDEADTAKKDGQVKIGSRIINYGDDESPTDPPAPPEELSISLDKTDEFIIRDSTTKITATVTPTGKEVEWTSSDGDIASVTEGTVTGNKIGRVTITAKIKGTETKAECLVRVAAKGNETLKDHKENAYVVPGNFTVVPDGVDDVNYSHDDNKKPNVQDGIVIEDEDRNQFVWIPVSNTDGDNNTTGTEENLIKKADGTGVEITLGRYTFKREKNSETQIYEDGTPTLVQKGSEYENQHIIDRYFQELETFREASGTGQSSKDVNATAKNLQAFVESVETNHGYYIGRYEASKGSGSTFGVGADQSFYKPLVQKSQPVWTSITQGNSSKVSRNMYNEADEESKYVESDLINSYMWDTAIVYIQAMGNSNYAIKNGTEINTSLVNTGDNNDHACNIYDMAGNVCEWTTENTTDDGGMHKYRCSVRGGSFNGGYAGNRNWGTVTSAYAYEGFRPGLYINCSPEG